MSPERNHGPITPAEAAEQQFEQIPDEVFIAFNGLIAQNLDRNRSGKMWSHVLVKDVVAELVKQKISRETIFNKHWLDVEDSYRAQGWEVTYDQPGWDEDYDSYFRFTAPKE